MNEIESPNKSMSKPAISLARRIVMIVAALVLNLAEIMLVGVCLAVEAIFIAKIFHAMEKTQLTATALVIGASLVMIATMMGISYPNVPFLCKQAGVTEVRYARMFGKVGAIVWGMALLFMFLVTGGNHSIGMIPQYVGFFGAAALQLYMGYRRNDKLGDPKPEIIELVPPPSPALTAKNIEVAENEDHVIDISQPVEIKQER